MTREEALNKTIGILTYHQVNFCKSKEAVANMNDIIEALEKIDQEPCGDCISREAVMHILDEVGGDFDSPREAVVPIDYIADMVAELPPVTPQPNKWIPVSERLPEDLEPVNITWVNHEPEPYYHDIKDKNYVATGIHYKGQWYWYSTTCADYLGEYGSNEVDKVDDAVEILAWMPLPEPYKAEGSDKE